MMTNIVFFQQFISSLSPEQLAWVGGYLTGLVPKDSGQSFRRDGRFRYLEAAPVLLSLSVRKPAIVKLWLNRHTSWLPVVD